MKAALVAVAYSAGRDSTALLHATWRAAQAQARAAPDGPALQVLALHVHHGLSPHADAWLNHAALQCERWARAGAPLRFEARRLSGRPGPGESTEAWARRERYLALADMAQAAGAPLVLLAHHQQDQAETFLLQALRGAGVAGLAAMPADVQRWAIQWRRPWLHHPREAIEAYVDQHGLRYVDDDSNTDRRFARNRLRVDVWPALVAAFPQAQGALADAAGWAQQAHGALQELAALDLAAISGVSSGNSATADAWLSLAEWAQLSVARRSNALRAWLAGVCGEPATAALVRRLLRELPAAAGPGTWRHGAGQLRRYRGRLGWTKDVAPQVPGGAAVPPGPPVPSQLSIRRAGRYRLPGWGGTLLVERVRSGGVPLAWLGELALKPRSGGEQFQSGLGRPPRSLKKQYQALGLPAWARQGPLVYSGGQLVFVPGLGLDARVLALPGQAQVQLRWQAFDAVDGP